MILHGDCLEEMAKMDAESVDAIVTDPPYGLEFMGKEWDRLSGGFSNGNFKGFKLPKISGGNRNVKCPDCGKWIYDHPPRNCLCGGVERLKKREMGNWHFKWAKETFRVAKPGAHLLAFGGTRTFHRLACAIEDAGWEIRDTLGWIYGSGFPKSHNLQGKWKGFGTALKPAWEPIILARKPLIGTVAENVLKYGTGAINVDGCRVEAGRDYSELSVTQGLPNPPTSWTPRKERRTFKPASGRWPANIIHDGSEEVLDIFPNARSSGNFSPKGNGCPRSDEWIGFGGKDTPASMYADSGSAARFFYCAKASRAEREAGLEVKNNHPTVKPLALMRYLCRLVTPPNGVILDPFMGSGTTGMAAKAEEFNFIGIEKEKEYFEIAKKRISFGGSISRQHRHAPVNPGGDILTLSLPT